MPLRCIQQYAYINFFKDMCYRVRDYITMPER